jgi:hypothetical protein
MISIRKDISIILFTGFSDEAIEEKALSVGIKTVIRKPLVIRKIANIIRKVLDNKSDRYE